MNTEAVLASDKSFRFRKLLILVVLCWCAVIYWEQNNPTMLNLKLDTGFE